MLGTWLQVLLLLPLVSAKESAFIVPTFEGTNVEFYDKDDIRYGIFLDKVAFEEARQTCLAKEGALVEFIHASTAKFIARALAESAVGFSTVWIGGVYNPATNDTPGVWKWLSGENITKHPIASNYTFPMTELPYWVGRPHLDSNQTACLVTDRNNHHRPLITGLPCSVRRPFICVMQLDQIPTGPEVVAPSIVTTHKTYYLYRAEYTWAEALTFCRSLGYKLAVVTEPDEFTQIQNRMRRVRPIMENAWISGAFIDGKWIWVSTNKEIPVDKNETGTNAPPWFQPDNIIMEGCLLADRHVCDYLVYLEAKCDRKRSVICQEDEATSNGLIKQVNGSNFFASTVRLSWSDATAMCAKCVKNGTLLQLASHNAELLSAQIKWLFTAMTVLFGTEIRHVWLNGLLMEDQFMWEVDPTGKNTKPWTYPVDPVGFSNSSSSLLKENGDHGFIMFCPGNFKTDPYLSKFKCLNLDRENMKHFFMYGLACGYKQHFICMSKNDQSKSTILQDTCRNPLVADLAKPTLPEEEEPDKEYPDLEEPPIAKTGLR